MAEARRVQRAKSIAGTFLIVLGIFCLHQVFTGAESWLRHVLCSDGCEAIGPAQWLQAYAAEPQSFRESVIRHMLVPAWPLLLIMFGTVLSRETNVRNINKEG